MYIYVYTRPRVTSLITYAVKGSEASEILTCTACCRSGILLLVNSGILVHVLVSDALQHPQLRMAGFMCANMHIYVYMCGYVFSYMVL